MEERVVGDVLVPVSIASMGVIARCIVGHIIVPVPDSLDELRCHHVWHFELLEQT